MLSNLLITSGETITLFILLYLFLMKLKYKQHKPFKTICKIYSKLAGNNKEDSKGKRNKEARESSWNKYALIFIMIGGFYWLFFAWSITFIDIAIASIIIELWLVVFVLARYFNKKHTPEKKSLSKSIWVLFIFSLLGIIYITLSHTNINHSFSYKGLLLLIVSLVVVSIRIERSLYWGERMFSKWENEHKKENPAEVQSIKKSKNNWEMVFVLLGVIIGNSFTITLIILERIFGFLRGSIWNFSFTPISIEIFANEIVITNTVSWVICIAGGVASAIGAWSFRRSNLYTSTLDINGISYLTPVLSLVWLLPFGLIQLQRWDYFVIGALIILATSIIIGIEDEAGRVGFRWLIVSLWGTGLLIYFREKWIQLPWLANDISWEWSLETVDYYSLIFVSSTIFILIFSFRHNRLVERTNREENQYLRMKQIIKDLDHDQNSPLMPNYPLPLANLLLKYPLINYLDQLDQFKTKTIGKTLTQFKNIIQYRRDIANKHHMEIDKLIWFEDKLSALELEFELLYRSKQRGRYLAENLVLYIFALVTIMITVGTRPTAVSAWNALLIDILAFLFSSAICFMTINLIDLRVYREKSTAELMNTEETGERTKDAINQKAVQIISIILAVVISISFVVLLYDKWMGI